MLTITLNKCETKHLIFFHAGAIQNTIGAIWMFIIISVMFVYSRHPVFVRRLQFKLTQHHKKSSDRRAADVRLRTYTDISRVISFLVHIKFDASQPGFMREYGDSEEVCVCV